MSAGWAGGALFGAAVAATLAKVAGVIVAPGLRGVASQTTVDAVDTVTAALAYCLVAFLVALVCAGAFDLARARRINAGARGLVVGLSGLVVALASPAVVSRLHTAAALTLAIVTSLVALVAGVVASRPAHTRGVGGLLGLLAVCGLLRAFAWEAMTVGGERASIALFHAGTVLATIAVIVQTLATLLAATWLATRSPWRGRLAANLAVFLAFAATYLAARDSEAPGGVEAVLRGSIGASVGVPLVHGFGSIAAFLVPVSILLAIVALIQRAQPATVLSCMALALLSHGSFDVPLQALAVLVSAQWIMLATPDERAMWAQLTRVREEPKS